MKAKRISYQAYAFKKYWKMFQDRKQKHLIKTGMLQKKSIRNDKYVGK